LWEFSWLELVLRLILLLPLISREERNVYVGVMPPVPRESRHSRNKGLFPLLACTMVVTIAHEMLRWQQGNEWESEGNLSTCSAVVWALILHWRAANCFGNELINVRDFENTLMEK
jgi:hypothetical protein